MIILSALIFLPIAGGLVILLIPRGREGTVRWIGLLASVAALVIAGIVFTRFEIGTDAMQFVERVPWVPALGITYHLGIDGIALPLVLLTAVMMPIALLSSWRAVSERVTEFTFSMLLLETALLGTFLSLDLILFFVFWEAVLIPMYLIIGLWGGPRRAYAAIKFLLYTMTGSALMLVAIILLYVHSGTALPARTFDLTQLLGLRVAMPMQLWLFGAFALAFAIKVPVWPLHTWLPDAHVEAPTAGSVILAAVLLKMGTYGFFRFLLPLFPEATIRFAPLLATLAIVGIIYGGIVSWAQQDMKRLVAMSSVSHLGLVTLGTFALTVEGLQGGLLQMVNHGISTGGLFLLVGVLYDRTHSREMDDYGGVAALMPQFAAVAMIVILSSMALPSTNGFVGEFLILLGAFRAQPAYAVAGVSGVILSAVYLLWMYQRVMQGPVAVTAPVRMADISPRELLTFVPLIAFIFALGLYPAPLLSRSEASVRALVARVNAARYDQRPTTNDQRVFPVTSHESRVTRVGR